MNNFDGYQLKNKKAESDAKRGVKNVAIVTPAFVSDCLETLEEIGMEAVDDFRDDGGENLYVIPCLNERDSWVDVISNWLNKWEKQDVLPKSNRAQKTQNYIPDPLTKNFKNSYNRSPYIFLVSESEI